MNTDSRPDPAAPVASAPIAAAAPDAAAPLTGGCLCGAVRYTLDAPVRALVACYCADCRRATGTAASINARVPGAAFRLVSGATRVFSRAADSGRLLERHFCADCGSPIYTRHADDEHQIILKVGSLDRQDGMAMAASIWTASAAPWAWIDRAQPCFPAGRPAPAGSAAP